MPTDYETGLRIFAERVAAAGAAATLRALGNHRSAKIAEQEAGGFVVERPYAETPLVELSDYEKQFTPAELAELQRGYQ